MLQGAMVALITPFNEEGIDRQALSAIVDRCLENGTEALVPCGTTGEGAVLSDREFEEVLALVLEKTQKRIPVIAGCGTNSTEKTIERGLMAKRQGVQAILVVTPYYNKPNQASLACHFKEVADRVELPLLLYNVPSRAGVDLLPKTVIQLAEHPLIVGIKEATGSIRRAFDLVHALPDDFTLLSGDDFTMLPFILSGGHGVISVVGNVAPGQVKELVRLGREGRVEEAARLNKDLYPLMEALFWDTNPVPVKMAMKCLGYGNGLTRLPLLPLNEQLTSELKVLLQKLPFISP
ncbi:4-hydroxy-tetrahydrodipicolinate synthase [bacterium]|nr:4-hydroxy-tetrahydrodipicolinate synthase [bacterium]